MLDRFDAVWQRVTGARNGATYQQTPQQETDPVRRELEELLRELAGLWRWYTDFSHRTKGDTARYMGELAQGVQLRFRQLQMEYFMQTGDICTLAEPAPWRGGVLTGLRKAYGKELELAGRFSNAADRGDARMAGLYRACGMEGKGRAERLRERIAQIIK